jgi:hypothetical protein
MNAIVENHKGLDIRTTEENGFTEYTVRIKGSTTLSYLGTKTFRFCNLQDAREFIDVKVGE